MAGFSFQHSYQAALPGGFLSHQPDKAPDPALFALNEGLAREMGLDPALLRDQGALWFSGAALPPGAAPVALAYSGHQFGGFSPVLGDGRAHLLGEFRSTDGRLWDLQLKGSGRTPFSRGGDGKAALGPMLREFLISEHMAALGIPTSRALAVAVTGEEILREGGAKPGAVLARIAASHIRIGTFQYFASRRDEAGLRALADYTIARHYPGLEGDYLGLFDALALRQARLIAAWMGAGFIHGVMNTDNMTLSGETIDYGPCAFMEAYAPGTVFSSIDRQGRYAYANQPVILAWNMARFAETLLPLLPGDQDQIITALNERLEGIAGLYRSAFMEVMRAKLGLSAAEPGDEALVDDLLLALQGADWTLSFYRLSDALSGDHSSFAPLFEDFTAMASWLPRWRARSGGEPDQAARMRRVNPAVIARNHQTEAALQAAEAGDKAPFLALLEAVRDPFTFRESYSLPAPQSFGRYVTFCGT